MGKLMVLGLTGQTGAGKTTVSRELSRCGIPVLDCDQVSRQVSGPDSPCLREITAAFGPEFLFPDGSLDRKKLGALVFHDQAKLSVLETITYRYILDEICLWLERQTENGEPLAVLDAPTLFESGADRLCGQVIAVVAPEEQRLERIIRRDGLGRQMALDRIHSQPKETFYRQRASVILENRGSEEDFLRRARALAESLHRKFL